MFGDLTQGYGIDSQLPLFIQQRLMVLPVEIKGSRKKLKNLFDNFYNVEIIDDPAIPLTVTKIL